ncbi:hypothetical protein IKH83_00065 [Candidatus Saccharibacteria bacterium]|nr:hypothetical protein [Candidatus Saccharibacteria bacterium]
MTRGGKNLILLGVASIAIAVTTTFISLAIYHNSGDIYIDRSRPGFLPDEEEIEEKEQEKESAYEFSENGEISTDVLKEYLEQLEKEADEIDAIESPFDAKALSDEVFGI